MYTSIACAALLQAIRTDGVFSGSDPVDGADFEAPNQASEKLTCNDTCHVNLKLNTDGEVEFEAKMRVIQKFLVASLFMWAIPIAILYAFNHNMFPGASNLSPYSVTLVSGFLAVISVNVVIAFYIYLAMREPADKHEPDPKFLAEAKASINQPIGDTQQSSQAVKKEQ
ncbi:unnamed protein product [Sphenostylis stenocarpa]|uniref:Vacuolar ATPase assembly integral membrane protein VMA21 homolog n=1 Tax=Sphenostylis stenocarpa TaxID=92480 RepID=A0AA86VHW1_9FABA|nr:unnamed protein product [Sphenostylis stenocarpa]